LKDCVILDSKTCCGPMLQKQILCCLTWNMI